MNFETPQEWAKRVANEIRAGKLTPPPVEEPVKDITNEEAIKLAKEIGREAAAKNSSVADKLRPYLIRGENE